jgi:hypothetical protein
MLIIVIVPLAIVCLIETVRELIEGGGIIGNIFNKQLGKKHQPEKLMHQGFQSLRMSGQRSDQVLLDALKTQLKDE